LTALAVTLSVGVLQPSATSAQKPPGSAQSVSAEDALKLGAEAYSSNDYNAALRWFRYAADRGVAAASFAIGLMYRDAKGVGQDHVVAMQSFQVAAEKGYVRALTAIGKQYLLGSGVPQNNTLAMSWFLKAANQGEIEAQARLAVMYTNGTGVQTDLAAAVAWYLKAIDPTNEAKQDIPGATLKQMKAAYEFAIGTIYEEGGAGVSKDLSTAKEWYRKASDHSNAQAKARLTELGLPQAAPMEAKTFLCEVPEANGKTQKSIVYVDTNSRFVRIDTLDQGILEYKDGDFGKIIKTGFRRDDAVNVHQFVIVEQGRVRFGFKDKGKSESTIDLRTGVFTIVGLLNRTGYCSVQSVR
jgi:TPR repeat protein